MVGERMQLYLNLESDSGILVRSERSLLKVGAPSRVKAGGKRLLNSEKSSPSSSSATLTIDLRFPGSEQSVLPSLCEKNNNAKLNLEASQQPAGSRVGCLHEKRPLYSHLNPRVRPSGPPPAHSPIRLLME